MLNLAEYRSKAKALPDLLNIAFLVDERDVARHKMGIALNKSGSLMAGFTFGGPDLESSSPNDLDYLSAHLNHAIARLGTGWALHIDMVRKEAPGYIPEELCMFPDPVSYTIDAERRQQHEEESAHFESRTTFIFSWDIPTSAESGLTKLILENADHESDSLKEHISRFATDMETIMNICGGSGVVAPLSSSDLLTQIHGCLTGDYHQLGVPKIPAYLDAALGAHDVVSGFEPRIHDGGQWQEMRAISISGWPSESFPEILESLNTLPVELRFSVRYIFIDPNESVGMLNKYRRNWFQKRHGVGTQVSMAMGGEGSAFENTDALSMTADADSAIAEASSNVIRFGFMSANIILFSPSKKEMANRVKMVRKHLDNLGFVSRVESINAFEAFMGSIPGHCYENVRRPLMNTMNLMDIAPTTSIWTGDEFSPNPFTAAIYRALKDDNGDALFPKSQKAPPLFYGATTGNTPFRFSNYVGDVGHTLIAGVIGSGKSTLLSLMAAQQLRYPDARVFSFDKGWSIFTLCKASGGSHYDIGNDENPITFAPLSRVHESASERRWAEDWIANICILQGVSVVDSARQDRIHQAIEALAAADGRSMTDFVNLVQDEEVRSAVHFYTLTGRTGNLLDASTDALSLDGARFSVFEMENLLGSGDMAKLVTVPVLLYIFHRIEKSLDGSPTMILLDEAWAMMDNPLFAEKIKEWLKVLRKFNTSVIFATQSLSDLKDSPLKPVIMESCLTKILLPNRNAAANDSAPLYHDLGLNDSQIKLLQQSTPKSDYYIVSPEGRRRITLAMGPVALAFCAVSDRKSVARVRELIAEHGACWPVEWLRERLPQQRQDWTGYLARLYDQV
ncbi:conjugal transfer protein TrbE [Acidithiobacillus thiooxidans]|uniref:Conjugal transfer protein TrbE n=1 Tax=Acidithiobacillus thiooxidans TaxID=930 RepID=A0A1C2HWW0_ACITH|nr:conjugal transfer protein TrbE [Acidithiobacillus thiooxidans]OCX68221.1 conjugal transfer protein TrbE [Acidithiobacillus thiooxidans]OCX77561.1 conjugal transfer protein TrbE [Acidithiobacillus thiooxidans]OCX79514.1 conjugal transfer protein TrbE [Acidithiobacillus thiooxidans]OCX85888.1 conjugal transfer protein TrbE [Acidithiobacillus thiooxidans]OFC51182.1 conjugal transfer protein TrbE [Acidithiobacillus thiooxidans]